MSKTTKDRENSKRRISRSEDGATLTDKEQLFVTEYLRSFKLRDALVAAGYKLTSPIGDEARARRILGRPEVAKEISDRLEATIMTRAEVLARLTEQGRNAYSKYIGIDGTVDLRQMIEDNMSHLIKGVRPTRFGRVIEFMDGQKALEMMGRYHKLFTDRIDQTSEVTLRVEYAEELPEEGEEE